MQMIQLMLQPVRHILVKQVQHPNPAARNSVALMILKNAINRRYGSESVFTATPHPASTRAMSTSVILSLSKDQFSSPPTNATLHPHTN